MTTRCDMKLFFVRKVTAAAVAQKPVLAKKVTVRKGAREFDDDDHTLLARDHSLVSLTITSGGDFFETTYVMLTRTSEVVRGKKTEGEAQSDGESLLRDLNYKKWRENEKE